MHSRKLETKHGYNMIWAWQDEKSLKEQGTLWKYHLG